VKVAILAGGLGTRLSEETVLKPKPMVEIGEHPVLWHIMQIYAAQGFKEFVVGLGYKGEIIKDYFVNYRLRASSLTVSLATGEVSMHAHEYEDWVIHLLETGRHTQTGGRVKRLAQFVGRERFMLTYGDGVANIDIQQLLAFHEARGKLATVTAVRPPARFGAIAIEDHLVTGFEEKPQAGEGWINGGFFVLEPGIIDYIDNDEAIWEREPMRRLAQDKQLVVYKHEDFWQCMDTLRDVRMLEQLWQSGEAPWKLG
jgi:glucose-1-phosphate cytidylyltransferase